MRYSRRTFVQHASAVAGLGLLRQLPGRRLWAAAPRDLLPELDEAAMRRVALTAIDAARVAGADFADVRVTVARFYRLRIAVERATSRSPIAEPPATGYAVDYGVRALVAGAWGFANGTLPTTDAVTDSATLAVHAARTMRPRHRRSLELAPAPIVRDGRWATPVERDPLVVPFGEQRDLAATALAGVATLNELASAAVLFDFRCPTVVFASTEGTLLVQRITLAEPGVSIEVRAGPDPAHWTRGGVALPVGGYGYEVIRPATLADDLRQETERLIARARHPMPRRAVPATVGRYDLVLAPVTAARLLAGTVGEALNLERALGFRANWDGTSFAAPPSAMLGQFQLASKLVTVRGDRSQRHGAATVGWDEEGVPPDAHTVIQHGLIMDYHTNRQTAMELAAWYRGRGEPVRSHGCARRTGRRRPIVRVPNLTLAPGTGETTVDDLIADTKRGLYLESGWANGDQQLVSAQGRGVARQIVNGKLGDSVRDFAFQFVTPQFWRNVDALGGAASAQAFAIATDNVHGDQTQPFPFSTVCTVPMRVRQVNVLNTGRRS